MQGDLKRIKKKYGEKMAHLCRELFSTLLENEGVLYELISSKFAPNKFLYEDIIEQDKVEEFKDFIYSLYDVEENKIITNKNPFELMKEANYTLYECESNEEILDFKKYYAPWEELCTFRDDRFKRNFVFFAVKDGADKLNREDFKKPKREDEYGTSVISIQFTKGRVNTLSIKNRYNHTVNNPDATFSNNLDNIIEGLTYSFEEYYNLNINSNATNGFFLENYVLANDHRYYKYNYELDNVYYCVNNIIIDNFEVVTDYVDTSKYLVIDYFVLDLNNKKIYPYNFNNYSNDSFCDEINIRKNVIEILPNGNKEITINDNIKIIVNKYHQMIGYINNEIAIIDNNFLTDNQYLEYIIINNVKSIGKRFLLENTQLNKIEVDNVKTIGDGFLFHAEKLESISLPNVETIGSNCLSHAPLLNLNIENAKTIGDYFLEWNNSLRHFKGDNITKIGDNFLHTNELIESISLPSLIELGDGFLYYNRMIKYVNFPSLEIVGRDFLTENNSAYMINIPLLKSSGIYFMYGLKNVDHLNLSFIEGLRKTSPLIDEYMNNLENNNNKVLKLTK